MKKILMSALATLFLAGTSFAGVTHKTVTKAPAKQETKSEKKGDKKGKKSGTKKKSSGTSKTAPKQKEDVKK